MTHKKRISFARLMLDLVMVVPNILGLASDMTSLIGIEARLAFKSLFVILLLSLFLSLLLITSWLCLLGMLFMYFLSLHWSLLFSVFMIFMTNSILFLILIFITLRIKNNLFFSRTRKKCRELCRACKLL